LASALLAIFALKPFAPENNGGRIGYDGDRWAARARARSLIVRDGPERVHVLLAAVRRHVQLAYHVRLDGPQFVCEFAGRLALRGQRFLKEKTLDNDDIV